nr:U3 small nucleolar ribonucleoprotein LCP5 [Phaffia rhodozyma]
MSGSIHAEASTSTLPSTLNTIKTSLTQVNAALSPILKSLRSDPSSFNLSNGLSLLSLRPNLLLSYIHLYTLLLGSSLSPSTAPLPSSSSTPSSTSSVLDSFNAPRSRTGQPSERDLIEQLVLIREVMERVRGMEGKVGKQVDRLVKGAEEKEVDLANDPMSFRPNPSALVKPNQSSTTESASSPSGETNGTSTSGVYRPPRLAAVPYLPPTSKSSKTNRAESGSAGKTSSLLTDYALSTVSHLPHQETVSGLPSLSSSARASRANRSLAQEQTEFEEGAFTRLTLKKSELKRREREERDDALGLGGGRNGGTGWEDVLGGLGGGRYDSGGDREKGGAWERRKRGPDEGESRAGPAKNKKGRFETRVGSKKGKN